jgi:hypothetical protein
MAAPDGYSVETIDPPDAPLEVGGLATREDGTLVVSTRPGQIWEYDPDAGEWSLFAGGLHQALGVWIDDDSGDVFTVQKPELTRLVDEDDDGVAELYRTINDEWGYEGNYHTFAFGPVRDSEGNFHLNLNLGHGAGAPTVGGAIMEYAAEYRGWHIKITPDGEFVPYASGLRSPSGIGINGDDEVFYTDNQGDWMPVCHLSLVEEDAFHGHPASLYGHPDFQNRDLESIPHSEYKEMRKPAAIWVPYSLSNATAGLTFDETGGAFGPFEGQVFMGEQTQSRVMRAALEKVNGRYQGAVFDFVNGLQCGTIREAFSPEGDSLWLGQTQRGWGSSGSAPYGLQRIDYDGETTPFAMHSISVRQSGFDITFTKAADESDAGDPGNYDVTHWTYNYSDNYGSSPKDQTSVSVSGAQVSEDGERATIDLPTVETRPTGGSRVGRIYEISVDVAAADGDTMANDTGWYTVNELPE